MADFSRKKITDLTEKTAPSDSDLFVAGNNGTATMRKMSFANIVSGIIGKLTGAVSSILTSNLTASRALISNSSGKVAASGVSSTELGYLSGASSNIQSQLSALNSKRGDVISIGRNYLSGIAIAPNIIFFLIPLNKNIASPSDGQQIQAVNPTLFNIHSVGNSAQYLSHVTASVGYVRKNGIDVQVTLDSYPSWLTSGVVVGIEFRGSITL